MKTEKTRSRGRRARVVLRVPEARDRKEFEALVEQSRAFLRPWEPRVRDPGGHERFRRLLAAKRSRDDVKWLVCRASDGAILGALSLNNVVRGVFQSAAMGYWIGAPHARQGYMTDAVALALARAFGPLRLHRVEVNFLPKNRASRALAVRAGFRREGRSRRFLKIAGRWEDHERFAILAEEWRARGRRAQRP